MEFFQLTLPHGFHTPFLALVMPSFSVIISNICSETQKLYTPQTWLRGMFWPKIEEGFINKNKKIEYGQPYFKKLSRRKTIRPFDRFVR